LIKKKGLDNLNDSDVCVISDSSKSDTSDDSRHAPSVEELHDVREHRWKKHTCIHIWTSVCVMTMHRTEG